MQRLYVDLESAVKAARRITPTWGKAITCLKTYTAYASGCRRCCLRMAQAYLTELGRVALGRSGREATGQED